MLAAEVETIGLLRNVETAVTATLSPTAVIDGPLLGAVLLPVIVSLPATALLPASLLLP